MLDIDVVIATYKRQYEEDPTDLLKEKLEFATNVKKCWYDVHVVTDEANEYPEVIHTHGLLYRFDTELEVDLTPFPTEQRMEMARNTVRVINDALKNHIDPHLAILDNKFYSSVKVDERLEEDDGYIMYDNATYYTTIYKPSI